MSTFIGIRLVCVLRLSDLAGMLPSTALLLGVSNAPVGEARILVMAFVHAKLLTQGL